MIVFGIKYAFFHTLVLQINGNYYQNEHTKVVRLACFDSMERIFEHLDYISNDIYGKKYSVSFFNIENIILEKLK